MNSSCSVYAVVLEAGFPTVCRARLTHYLPLRVSPPGSCRKLCCISPHPTPPCNMEWRQPHQMPFQINLSGSMAYLKEKYSLFLNKDSPMETYTAPTQHSWRKPHDQRGIVTWPTIWAKVFFQKSFDPNWRPTEACLESSGHSTTRGNWSGVYSASDRQKSFLTLQPGHPFPWSSGQACMGQAHSISLWVPGTTKQVLKEGDPSCKQLGASPALIKLRAGTVPCC